MTVRECEHTIAVTDKARNRTGSLATLNLRQTDISATAKAIGEIQVLGRFGVELTAGGIDHANRYHSSVWKIKEPRDEDVRVGGNLLLVQPLVHENEHAGPGPWPCSRVTKGSRRIVDRGVALRGFGRIVVLDTNEITPNRGCHHVFVVHEMYMVHVSRFDQIAM
jgi:hypothetical protein